MLVAERSVQNKKAATSSKSKQHLLAKVGTNDLHHSHTIYPHAYDHVMGSANTDDSDSKYSNFQKIMLDSGWLFCNPLSDHIALDRKRQAGKPKPSRIGHRIDKNPKRKSNLGGEKNVERSSAKDDEDDSKSTRKQYTSFVRHWKIMHIKNYKIVSISCGKAHYVMVSGILDGRQLLCLGENNRGQLGI